VRRSRLFLATLEAARPKVARRGERFNAERAELREQRVALRCDAKKLAAAGG